VVSTPAAFARIRRLRLGLDLVAAARERRCSPARAQEPERVHRLGAIIPVGRQTPAIVAFFDEMRLSASLKARTSLYCRTGLAFAMMNLPSGRKP